MSPDSGYLRVPFIPGNQDNGVLRRPFRYDFMNLGDKGACGIHRFDSQRMDMLEHIAGHAVGAYDEDRILRHLFGRIHCANASGL